MAGIPQNFQALSNVLPTYQFIDLASGTGIIEFFAGKTVDLNLLSNTAFYSDSVLSDSATFTDAGWVKQLDIDFDVILNRPLVLKGKTVVNVPVKVYASQDTSHVYVKVIVRKWTGSVETDLVSNDSSENTAVGVGAITYAMKAVDVDVPLTVFKIGEYLRLTLEVYGKRTAGGGNGTVGIGHDPMNRTTGWDGTGTVPSKLVFQCPVRLNL